MCEYFIQLDNWNYFTVYFSDVTLEEMLCLFGLLCLFFALGLMSHCSDF
jgi:hypothetical protein